MKCFMSVVAAATLVAASVLPSSKYLGFANAQTSFGLLNETRSSIKFPEYTAQQRTLIAEQAKLLLSVYVNRESKLTFYGKEIDPLPRIQKIVETAAALSNIEFHTQMSSLFVSLRDFHTNYILPAPYSCYQSVLPFTTKEVYSETASRRVAVDSIRKNLLTLAPEARKLNVGDVLVSYDGKTLDQLVQENVGKAGGANNFGGFSSVTNRFLTSRNQLLYTLPESDFVSIQFQRADKSRYTLSLPWLTVANDACLATAPRLLEAAPGPEATESAVLAESKHLLADSYNEIFGSEAEKLEENGAIPTLLPTRDDTVKFTTINNKNGKFGFISYTSFVPKNVSTLAILDIFRDLLVREFNNTNGVIIDIRANGGGNIVIADALSQLFTAGPIIPMGARAVVSPLNEKIFTETAQFKGSAWETAYRSAKPGTLYGGNAKFTSEAVANIYGRVYFGPVAVLTNANCYSACDIFSAAMQDNGAATIWNEDLLTGAGGANVVDTAFFVRTLSSLPENPFKTLPAGQYMRVAWRQIVRGGPNANRLIEDRGILADRRARPLLTDVTGETNSQIDKITQEFKYQQSNYQSAFYTDFGYATDITQKADGALSFGVRVRGISKLIIKDQTTSSVLATVPVTGATTSTFQQITIVVPTREATLPAQRILRIEAYGYGKLVSSTNHVLSIIA